MEEILGIEFTMKDELHHRSGSIIKNEHVYILAESKHKGKLIVRRVTGDEPHHNTVSIKEAQENIKKGKWILKA